MRNATTSGVPPVEWDGGRVSLPVTSTDSDSTGRERTPDNHERCVCWWCWREVWTDEHDFFGCHDRFVAANRWALGSPPKRTLPMVVDDGQGRLDLGSVS